MKAITCKSFPTPQDQRVFMEIRVGGPHEASVEKLAVGMEGWGKSNRALNLKGFSSPEIGIRRKGWRRLTKIEIKKLREVVVIDAPYGQSL